MVEISEQTMENPWIIRKASWRRNLIWAENSEFVISKSTSKKFKRVYCLCYSGSYNVPVFWFNFYDIGQENKESTVQKLIASLDHFQQMREQEQEEERKRMEREQFRREQNEEYQRSLAADRVKQQELRRQQIQAREEEEKKQKEEHDKQQRIGVLNDILPSEPAENEPNVIKIRFRCPNGELKDRRFRPDESIEMMLIYGETIGFDREQYTFMTSDRPNKEVNNMDSSKSFAAMGWKRELITIREV